MQFGNEPPFAVELFHTVLAKNPKQNEEAADAFKKRASPAG